MSDKPQPILIDLPAELAGDRVVLRPYRTGDGAALWDAVEESRDHIVPWLPWGDKHKSPADSEAYARRCQAQWVLREDLSLALWSRDGGAFLGATGLHRIDWEVPSFEIGYWLRKSAVGRGYMTEAVRVITAMAFETLRANRVFIRCATANERSAGIPKRLGFTYEGTFRSSNRNTYGDLYDMMTFGMTREEYERVMR